MSTQQLQTSVITAQSALGGMVYPFLPAHADWQLIMRPLEGEDAITAICAAPTPTLRWVKDDKVMDLVIPGLDTESFLAQSGLELSLHKGGYVLSKRLSRIMRPFRYWGFFSQSDVALEYNPRLNAQLWDGCGLISRSFVERLADQLSLSDHHRHELLNCGRFEITTLHSQGQDKGHVLVVDDLACDLLFPTGSAKQELSLKNGQVFVGLHPVHSEDQMCLDVQSIINLHPFFSPETLLVWTHLESELFLRSIESGQLEGVMGRLYSEHDLAQLANWHVGEYLASGGKLMWFAGMVKAVAKQHLHRLGNRTEKLRVPAPGGRYYLFPAAIGERDVLSGHIELDPMCATAWVNDADWLDYIVPVLGGCDGDDAVWVLPFRDASDKGQKKLLVWRSPNQVGEYVILKPTAGCHEIRWDVPGGQLTYPVMQSRLLPTRIDRGNYQYGSLPEAGDVPETGASYSPNVLLSTIIRAAANRGVLGAHCNVLMLTKAIYGQLPHQLPATLEAVIDGSVKTGLDLAPVKEWNAMAIERLVAHGHKHPHRAIPQALLGRLPEWLQAQAPAAAKHWLDVLVSALELHRQQFWADVCALATTACPPLELFEASRDWLQVGREFRRVYGDVIRQAIDVDGELDETTLDAARVVSENYLSSWPADRRHCVLIGAAAYAYAMGSLDGEPVRDGVLWQLGVRRGDNDGCGREPGIAQEMIQALRRIGLLGEPVWTTVGVVLHYQDSPCRDCAGVPVTINGTWFNLLNVTSKQKYGTMGDVPLAVRQQAKERVAELAQTTWPGMTLTTHVNDNNRVVTHTPQGNLFGYVHRDHELLAVKHDQWQVAWAMALDGNVRAILRATA